MIISNNITISRITKPDPRALTVFSFEPPCFGSIKWKIKKIIKRWALVALCLTTLVVAMFTTEGDNFSARSEKVSGALKE